MEKAKIKNSIIQSIIILMGILLLVSLAFPLIKATFTKIGDVYISGYLREDFPYKETYTDTGFNMLGFKSSVFYVDIDAHYVTVILGVFAYLQLFLSLGIITIGIIGSSIKNGKLEKAAYILMIVGVSFSAWYMIEGILYSAIYHKYNGSETSTGTWLAFLLCALSFTAYILCKYLIKDDYALPTDHTNNNLNKSQTPTTKSLMTNISLLKQYKELLGNGIITQEEFDEKKKELI